MLMRTRESSGRRGAVGDKLLYSSPLSRSVAGSCLAAVAVAVTDLLPTVFRAAMPLPSLRTLHSLLRLQTGGSQASTPGTSGLLSSWFPGLFGKASWAAVRFERHGPEAIPDLPRPPSARCTAAAVIALCDVGATTAAV